AGYTVHNRVVLNQIIASGATDAETVRVISAAQESGRTWFGGGVWRGRRVLRISVSSWRTRPQDVRDLIDLLGELRRQHRLQSADDHLLPDR
ncbi:hypothetical protein O7617_00005, partial [Micromonospora sp. WMMD1155]